MCEGAEWSEGSRGDWAVEMSYYLCWKCLEQSLTHNEAVLSISCFKYCILERGRRGPFLEDHTSDSIDGFCV